VPANEADWGKEFLALIAAIKVVDSLDEALEHIERYGSGHSEAIITENKIAASRFLNEADAACVYANASTRFTDGSQFGLGAEIGISTQKFHARGPMALREITTYKWIIIGNGQVRP
jgi:glutamate-5-semialdehyde dehydrogenase